MTSPLLNCDVVIVYKHIYLLSRALVIKKCKVKSIALDGSRCYIPIMEGGGGIEKAGIRL